MTKKPSLLLIVSLIFAIKSEASTKKECDQDDIDHYLAVHNCMIESSSEDCMELSLNPGGVLGFAAGFGGSLLKKGHPDLHEGLQKVHELDQELPEIKKKLPEFRREARAEANELRLKIIDDLLDDFKGSSDVVEELQKLRRHPENELSPVIDETAAGQKIREKLGKYEDKVDEIVSKKIKNGGFKISKPFSLTELKNIFWLGAPPSFAHVPEVQAKYFPNEYKKMLQLRKDAEEVVTKQVLSDPEAKKIYESGNETSDSYREIKRTISRESKHLLEKLVRESSPKLKAYYALNRYSYELPLKGDGSTKIPGPGRNRTLTKLAKAGALGALGEVATEAVLNWKGKEELKSCRLFFDLSNEELAFLNNESIILAGSHVRSDLSLNNCESMYLSEPEKTISEAVKKFGKVSWGLCRIMRSEVKRLTKSMEETMQNSSPDCSTRSFTTDSVAVRPLKQGHSEAQITLKKGDNTFIYEAPIVKDTNFPDFRFVKVYRMKNGEKKLDDLLTMDFLKLYNNLKPNENFDQLMTPEKMFENDEQRKTFKKIRDRKYNAIMTQFYRGYVEGCRAYNRPECEVMERGLNIAPFMANMKTVCGEEKIESSTTGEKKKPSTSQQ